MKFLALVVAFLILATGAGCGKKEAPPLSQTEKASVMPAELPELEQNKPRHPPVVPDPEEDVFEPVPNEMEEIPQEELELTGPPID